MTNLASVLFLFSHVGGRINETMFFCNMCICCDLHFVLFQTGSAIRG